MNTLEKVEKGLVKHYTECLASYGPTPQGVGWLSSYQVCLRYDRMLRVIDTLYGLECPTILDAGCGYGGLWGYAKEKNIAIVYTGIDTIKQMIDCAQAIYVGIPFLNQDILTYQPKSKFDYVVCNGVLTLKMGAKLSEMDVFFKAIVKKLFSLCNVGIAFNVYSTYVGWFGEITYYKNPLEILAYCLSELSTHIKIDHSYRDHEYTIYVYKDNVSLEESGIGYQNV